MASLSPGTSQSNLPPSVAAAEQRAREFLARDKWRKARDELKPLVKADRARYLPLLIQANVGLAREMMAKGQVSEAQQVLSYLATIAPPEQLRAVELELAGKSGTAEAALPKFVAVLADPNAQLSQAERVRLADILVLAFQPVPAAGAVQEGIAAEVRAVHDALMAVSQGEWVKVSAVLRAIPHRSAFSHWATFVKGVAGFHGGDTDRAEKCFRTLPPESIPAKASQAYLLLTDRSAAAKGGAPATPVAIEEACRLAGTPGLGGVLLRANKAWQEGRYAESYRVFREALRQFPLPGLGWLGALSEFYFHAPHGMSEAERADYLRFFDGLICRRALKSGTEEMLTRRMFALLDGAIMPAWNLRQDWESFLRQHEALHGHNPRLASLACGWLGQQLSMTRSAPGFFPTRRPQLRDPNGAVEMLQRSIELDPNNLAAHLHLCLVYDALKQTSERNRLLDVMTARFPDDKQVLLRAAQGCIERKAFVKGLDYLTRTRQLDPLDPAIPELMATAQRRLARQYFQQRKPDKARQTLALTEEFLVDNPDNLQRSRWTALVRHGLMERLWGDGAQGEALMVQARALVPDADACLLFAHLAHRVYTNTRQGGSPFLAEFKEALRSAPSIGRIGRLLRIVDYWKNSPEAPQLYDEELIVRNCFKAAFRQSFTRAEALEVIGRVEGNFVFEDQVEALVKKLLRDDPLDPQVRLLKLGLSGRWEFNPAGSRSEVQSILDEAVRRHDDASVRKARELFRQIDRPLLPPPGPFDVDFGESEADDDDDFDDLGEPGGPLPPDLPPEELAQFSEILEQLRAAPDSVIRQMRNSRPKDMPKFVFDELLRIAQGDPLPPVPPMPRQPFPRPEPPKPAPPPPDPNQLNLF